MSNHMTGICGQGQSVVVVSHQCEHICDFQALWRCPRHSLRTYAMELLSSRPSGRSSCVAGGSELSLTTSTHSQKVSHILQLDILLLMEVDGILSGCRSRVSAGQLELLAGSLSRTDGYLEWPRCLGHYISRSSGQLLRSRCCGTDHGASSDSSRNLSSLRSETRNHSSVPYILVCQVGGGTILSHYLLELAALCQYYSFILTCAVGFSFVWVWLSTSSPIL